MNVCLSLAKADIEIAMGSGVDFAIESSALVLIKSEFSQLIYALNLTKNKFKEYDLKYYNCNCCDYFKWYPITF